MTACAEPVNFQSFSVHFQSISVNFILRHKHARFNSPSSAFREVCKPCAAWKPPNTPRKPKLSSLKHKLHKFTARIGVEHGYHGSEILQMHKCCQGTEPLFDIQIHLSPALVATKCTTKRLDSKFTTPAALNK